MLVQYVCTYVIKNSCTTKRLYLEPQLTTTLLMFVHISTLACVHSEHVKQCTSGPYKQSYLF